MKKKLLLSCAVLISFVSALLLAVLVLRPQQTYAAGAAAPLITVSPRTLSNANCTALPTLTSDMSAGYQACTLTVSTPLNWLPNGLRWSVTPSASFCYLSCSSPAGYIAILQGDGGTFYGNGGKQQVTVLVPRGLVEGSLHVTWTFTGPGNTVKVTGSFS